MSDYTSKKTNFLRLSQILAIYPISKSTVYRKIQAGEFPKPYKIGPKTSVWCADEVYAFWQNIKERNGDA